MPANIYVLNHDGTPLMPSHSYGRVVSESCGVLVGASGTQRPPDSAEKYTVIQQY